MDDTIGAPTIGAPTIGAPTIGAPKKRKEKAIGRAAALRRSGLIFLGGFATSGLASSPALATHGIAHLDNPPLGLAITGGKGFVRQHAGGKAVPETKPPRKLRAYRAASYVALIMKRYNDTYTSHAGLPTSDDLDSLNIPIPPGLHRLASFIIPYTDLPKISGLDETYATKLNGAYHGKHSYTPNDPNDPGSDVWGQTQDNHYDIFVLVYGKRRPDQYDVPSDDDD